MRKCNFLHILLLVGVSFTLMTQTESQAMQRSTLGKMIVRVIRNKHGDVKLFFFFCNLYALRCAGFVQRNSRDWRCDEALVALFDFACYFSPFFSCPLCYLRLLMRHRIRHESARETREEKNVDKITICKRCEIRTSSHFNEMQTSPRKCSSLEKSQFWITVVSRLLNVSTSCISFYDI